MFYKGKFEGGGSLNRITERTRVRPIRRFAPQGELHKSPVAVFKPEP